MIQFFGYDNEADLRKYNPRLADEIIRKATRTKVNVCNRSKKCMGSIDGRTYHYADGSQDQGVLEIQCRSECFGNVYMWHESSNAG